MKKTNLPKSRILCLVLLLLFCQNIFANTIFGGIEIGSKGIKISILDVENAKKNIFTLKDF